MRIIVLSGAPGAGKTETGRTLIERARTRSAWIDTDKLAGIQPWVVDGPFHDLLGANLRSSIENYRTWGARVLVISGVIVPGGLLEQLEPMLARGTDEWIFYALVASHPVLARRIRADDKKQDPEQRLRWLWLNEKVRELPSPIVIDTSELTLDQVAGAIAARENRGEELFECPAPAATPAARTVRVTRARAIETGATALEGAGADRATAELVAAKLVACEADGYASHGLLRVPEYVEAVSRKEIDPRARPEVRPVGPAARVVEARRAFGALAAGAVCAAMREVLAAHALGVVALRDSGHIGRLAEIGAPLAREGYVVFGCVNFLGGGRKLAPWGGSSARLATNPLLFSFPRAGGEAIVVDLCASAVSEGRVRVASLRGEMLPPGWLVDRDGRPVTDPRRLYEDPPSAMLAFLGGEQGHKGFALALAVEILAGVIAGGTPVSPDAPGGGNGGLFIGLRPAALGVGAADLERRMEALLDYLKEDAPGVRIPGERRDPATDTLDVLEATWDRVSSLARR